MVNENLARQIMEVYLEGAKPSLGLVAAREGADPEKCLWEWDAVVRAGAILRGAPALEPSQMVINRVLAHAREGDSVAVPLPRFGFLSPWFKPAAAFAGFMILMTAGILTYRTSGSRDVPAVAVTPAVNATVAALDTTPGTEWILQTPPDFRAMMPPTRDRYRLLGPAALMTPVSLGEFDPTPPIDDELDRKILADSVLTDKELEVLFFRARKLEKLGYYREALKDYEFINRFNSSSVNLKSVHLAMSACLEKLERKEDAIMLLKRFETAHGASQEIDLRIDELKSVSF